MFRTSRSVGEVTRLDARPALAGVRVFVGPVARKLNSGRSRQRVRGECVGQLQGGLRAGRKGRV